MPKLSDEEREQRRQKVQKEALEAVAARGQFNFRLDGTDIKRLHKLAGQRQTPVSAMVREWVLERLKTEESNSTVAPVWAQQLEERLKHTEVLIAAALVSGASQGDLDDDLKGKVREHILSHCNSETSDELHSLFWK